MTEQTETKGMTISAALKELKHIDKKIDSRVAQIQEFCVGTNLTIPRFGEKQADKVNRLIQSAFDLIERKFDLKEAIERANLDTTITWKGKQYSLRKILFMKAEGFSKQGRVLQALNVDKNMQDQIERENRNREKDNLLTMVRYFDADKRDKQKEELMEMFQNLDNLLEHANFTGLINIEPWEGDAE